MKILILAQGSRGDVEPFVALGKGLKAAGHNVKVCVPSRFERFVTEHGLCYSYMNDDIIKIIDTSEGSRVIERAGTGGIFAWVRIALETLPKVRTAFRNMLDEEWAAAQGMDAIVYHTRAMVGYDIAEKLGIPAFLALPQPLYVPTSAFPNFIFPDLPLGGGYNRLTHHLTTWLTKLANRFVNPWRQEVLGLPKRDLFDNLLVRSNGTHVPIFFAISPHVLPPPTDWPPHVHTTGYWFVNTPNAWQPPAELVDFINAGPRPIYIGFGSMPSTDPQAKGKVILEALHKTGQRAIVSRGWGGFDVRTLPDTVMAIDVVPHSWLFPRMAAVVHHGGAGTTAAGLRAGKPSIICPFFADQPFWGKRVTTLGVGPQPIPQHRLTADTLAQAIRIATEHQPMRERAFILGSRIQAEDGIRVVTEHIETYAASF